MLYKIYGRGLRDQFGGVKEESENLCFVTADMTSITQNGDLLFLRVEKDGDKSLILALASCEWRSVYECNENGKIINLKVF